MAGLGVPCTTAAQTPAPAAPQPPAPPRPQPPTRDPATPGYVTAKELPDGTLPPTEVDGNFIIGPTHNPSPEATVQDGVPQGTVLNLTMNSADSKTYPGIARDAGTFGTCVVDGGPIEEKRLDAVPWTRYCLKHEALLEASSGSKTPTL